MTEQVLRRLAKGCFALMLLCGYVHLAGAMEEDWKPGVHYTVLAPAAPVTATPGTIEVREVFLYTNPYSNKWHALLYAWLKERQERIAYVRSPSIQYSHTPPQARMFLTLRKLGREDLHERMFKWAQESPRYEDYHFRSGYNRCASEERVAAQNLAFAKANGIDEQLFLKTYHSKEMSDEVVRAAADSDRYHVFGTSTFVINGKYSVSAQRIAHARRVANQVDEGTPFNEEDYKRLLELMDWLIRKEEHKELAPIPLEIGASIRAHLDEGSFDLSPDGRWLAHTIALDEEPTAAPDGPYHLETGTPIARRRLRATLTATQARESVELGASTAMSWAPTWSPDGRSVAYYSDESGTVGLWLWSMATRASRQVNNIIPRPLDFSQAIEWSTDGRSVLVKILPEGVTVHEANTVQEASAAGRSEKPLENRKEAENAGSTVIVLNSRAPRESGHRPPAVTVNAHTQRWLGDLALVDVSTGRIERAATSVNAEWYRMAPNQKYIVYSANAGLVTNSTHVLHDIFAVDVTSGAVRKLLSQMRLLNRHALALSRDSRTLAIYRIGNSGRAALSLVSIADGSVREVVPVAPSAFELADDGGPPLWDSISKHIFSTGTDGNLWRIHGRTFQARKYEIPGFQARYRIGVKGSSVVWTTDGGRRVWLTARHRTSHEDAGIFGIDLATGEHKQILKGFIGPDFDASDRAQAIAFLKGDQQHLPDGWIVNVTSGATKQVTYLNPELHTYAPGDAHVIEYSDLLGRTLRSALLLPPRYRAGQRLPMVVWVYGGNLGSRYVNTYGFEGTIAPVFNMHMLATRGYAVLYPDMPRGVGSPVKDLLTTVMPAVEAAVAQGYADGKRVALMGHSYGAYGTLALISQTKEFKAAIITGANIHPDLVASYLRMSRDGSPLGTGYYERGQGAIGGTLWEFPERYRENSPIYRFDQIETPLLIGQGEEDGTLLSADAVFVALRRLNKAVEYRIYPKEGHGLLRKHNVVDFWRRRIEFLDEHLKVTRDNKGHMRLQ